MNRICALFLSLSLLFSSSLPAVQWWHRDYAIMKAHVFNFFSFNFILWGSVDITKSLICDIDHPNATWPIECEPRTFEDDSNTRRFIAGVASLFVGYVFYNVAEGAWRQVPAEGRFTD